MQCVKQHSSYEYPWVPYLTSVKNSFIHHSFSHSYNLNVKLHVHTCLMVLHRLYTGQAIRRMTPNF